MPTHINPLTQPPNLSCISFFFLYSPSFSEPLVAQTFDTSSVASLPLRAVAPTRSFSPSQLSTTTGPTASFLPGPRAHFLFVMAQGATCPERPTAWLLPAVSTWHSLACWAGLHLQRLSAGTYIHKRVHARKHTRRARSRQCCHLPSTTTGHKVTWCKMINEPV